MLRVLSCMLLLCLPVSVLAEPVYHVWYGDLNGDGQTDFLLVPGDDYLPMVASIFAERSQRSDLPRYVIWGASSEQFELRVVNCRAFSTHGLTRAEIILADINADGMMDAIVLARGTPLPLFALYQAVEIIIAQNRPLLARYKSR